MMSRQITDKQWGAIYAIQGQLKIKFYGRTKGQAGAFIRKYMNLSKATSKEGQLTNESAMVLLFK